MLDIITKKEYYSFWEDQIADQKNHSLKGIQDAFVLSILRKERGKRIAEIGGGNSRILPKIKDYNECYNIEKFEGMGLGPTTIIDIPGVIIIKSYIGEFDNMIKNNFFDVLFSISVVEHIETDELDLFFKDCHRILKTGGYMVHAIDIYLDEKVRRFKKPDYYLYIKDRKSDFKYLHPAIDTERIEYYRQAVEKAGFLWHSDPSITKGLVFSTKFASNSDLTMAGWNKVSPLLRAIRENMQSVSIKMIAKKI